jgi:hypothetical protein
MGRRTTMSLVLVAYFDEPILREPLGKNKLFKRAAVGVMSYGPWPRA